MLRTLGKEMLSDDGYDASARAAGMLLEEIGVGTDGLRMVDGSGLSRQNYASASFICRFLDKMAGLPCFGDFLLSLPSPGEGTLKNVLKDSPLQVKERIRMKSGSMGGVRCFCWYVLPEAGDRDDIVVFCIMVNNCVAPVREIQPFFDGLVGLFAENR